uniref:G-protein coupled receptors family 1 profile domain-containing protein n=1 Tax=Branchiostoma floridae TaxID=7739 RepID=C3ZJW6_BRAFL|eukprot:XP_002591122.1 hypothetical protein BRAFLDRAFT_105536 [Branchiostoma floridae]
MWPGGSVSGWAGPYVSSGPHVWRRKGAGWRHRSPGVTVRVSRTSSRPCGVCSKVGFVLFPRHMLYQIVQDQLVSQILARCIVVADDEVHSTYLINMHCNHNINPLTTGCQTDREPARQGAKQIGSQPSREPASQTGCQTDRQPDREPDRQAARPTGSQTNRLSGRHGARQTRYKAYRGPDRQGARQTGSQTYRESDRQGARQKECQTDREPDRQGARQTGSQTDREPDGQGAKKKREPDREPDRQGAKQKDWQTDRERDRQGVRQTGSKTDRESDRQGARPKRDRRTGRQKGARLTGSQTKRVPDRQGARHTGSQTNREQSITRISASMFNNSSESWLLTEQTFAPEISNLLSCYRWFMQNKTASIAQANEACSVYGDLVTVGTVIAIKERYKSKPVKPKAVEEERGTDQNKTLAVKNPRNIAQEEARRKFEGIVHRAKTVMIHVVVAFFFWLLPCILVAICRIRPDLCPSKAGIFASICANSVTNPLATLIRTPDLRKVIWQKLTKFRRTVFSVFIRNRAIEEEEQPGPEIPPPLQGATQKNTRILKELQPTLENSDCKIQSDEQETTGQDKTSYKTDSETRKIMVDKITTENSEKDRNERQAVVIFHI